MVNSWKFDLPSGPQDAIVTNWRFIIEIPQSKDIMSSDISLHPGGDEPSSLVSGVDPKFGWVTKNWNCVNQNLPTHQSWNNQDDSMESIVPIAPFWGVDLADHSFCFSVVLVVFGIGGCLGHQKRVVDFFGGWRWWAESEVCLYELRHNCGTLVEKIWSCRTFFPHPWHVRYPLRHHQKVWYFFVVFGGFGKRRKWLGNPRSSHHNQSSNQAAKQTTK